MHENVLFWLWMHTTRKRIHSESPDGIKNQTCTQYLHVMVVSQVLWATGVTATSSKGFLVNDLPGAPEVSWLPLILRELCVTRRLSNRIINLTSSWTKHDADRRNYIEGTSMVGSCHGEYENFSLSWLAAQVQHKRMKKIKWAASKWQLIWCTGDLDINGIHNSQVVNSKVPSITKNLQHILTCIMNDN